jgi:hypothetical protein
MSYENVYPIDGIPQFPFGAPAAIIASENGEDIMSAFITGSTGAAGGVRSVLRLEGLALFAAALALHAQTGGTWTMFAMLFFVPDLSFAFYAAGPRIGAIAYNASHSTIGPIALTAFARIGGEQTELLWPLALIWFAHVGFDRALGYGLKYASGFSDTHLGPIGKTRRQSV